MSESDRPNKVHFHREELGLKKTELEAETKSIGTGVTARTIATLERTGEVSDTTKRRVLNALNRRRRVAGLTERLFAELYPKG